MNVLVTLDPTLEIGLGTTFSLTADIGVVTPSSATKTELLAGIYVVVDNLATIIYVTSEGTCTNTLTIPITEVPTTTTTTTIPTSIPVALLGLNSVVTGSTYYTITYKIDVSATFGIDTYYNVIHTMPHNEGVITDIVTIFAGLTQGLLSITYYRLTSGYYSGAYISSGPVGVIITPSTINYYIDPLGVTTTTTTTGIPILRDFVLFYSYTVNYTSIGFLDTFDHASKAICYNLGFCPPADYQGLNGEVYQAYQITVGYTVYYHGVPVFTDGYYVYSSSMYTWVIVHIVGGIIISVDSYICTGCPDGPTTTTTTTTNSMCDLEFVLADSTTTTTSTTGIISSIDTIFIYIPNL